MKSINTQKKCLLIILDGWGIGDKSISDLIYIGETPYYKQMLSEYPNAKLLACGEDVGLPNGQMGNSEVGHLNIGAGRIVYQDLMRINKEIEENTMKDNPMIIKAMKTAKQSGKSLHFIGLLGDGGVHSLSKHLFALIDIAESYELKKIFIHALMDGRDTDPHSGKGFMQELLDEIKDKHVKIASICGRYYTMDRDKRWERIKQGYDLLVSGKGIEETDPIQAIENSYKNGISDEFIKPTVIVDENSHIPVATIEKDDVVICFNFRTDRLREITTVLTQKNMSNEGMHSLPLSYYTMTNYDENFQNINVIYDKAHLKQTLGEVISQNGLRQLRIAETEKYAHVTFFFSGGREEPFEGEDRILIPSPKVATYDLKPEMSAPQVKNAVIEQMETKIYDFICLNFANGDMVGHTGNEKAILKAVSVIDTCLKDVSKAALDNKYDVLVIADHGNADHAKNEDGSPNTAHSLNPVPCIYLSKDKRFSKVKDGKLCDVAPTILEIMNLPKPPLMTGQSLII